MNRKSKRIVLTGVGLIVAAGLMAVRLVWVPDPGGGASESPSWEGGVAGSGGDVAGSPRSERRDVDGKRGRAKALEVDWGAYQPLDWSVEELDEYLAKEAKTLSGREMAIAMTYLFPYPEGGEDRPNRLRAGSIPLNQQMRLCEKYLEPEHRQVAYAGIWALYRSSGALDEYRRGFLEQLPADSFRRARFGDYFQFRHADYESLAEFLVSNDLATLREGEVAVDYLGATDAVEWKLRETLESGAVSLAEIVGNLRSSVLDVASQNRIIASLEKRAADIEIMRCEEETQDGVR